MQTPSSKESRQRLICACPKCDQHLFLMDDQLEAAEGWVRCSTCEQVFLALACLLDVQRSPLKAQGRPSWEGKLEDPHGESGLGLHASRQEMAFAEPSKGHGPGPMSIDEFLHQQSLTPTTHQLANTLSKKIDSGAVSQDAPTFEPHADRALQQALEPSHPYGSAAGMVALEHARQEVRAHPRAPQPGGAVYGFIGLLIFLFVLPLGFTFRYRDEVAALYPGLKEPLVQMCQLLSCQVEWPRDLSALSIESSALEKEDLIEKDPKLGALVRTPRFKYHLSLRIKNSFSYPVATPTLKLILLDERDQVLLEERLSLVFDSKDAVIKPGGLNQFLLPIHWEEDASGHLPSGYRVELE